MMNISKVKLVDGGLKGLEVEYLKPEGKESHKWLNEYKVKYKTPANAELRVAVDEMKKHLINICMFDKGINDLDIEVIGIHCNGRQFLISGKIRTLEHSYFAINTPLVKEDSGYGLFAECIKQIDVVYEWVSKYVELGAKVDYEKVAEDLRMKGKLDLEGKTAEQIKIEAMNILEEMGCVILEQMGEDDLVETPGILSQIKEPVETKNSAVTKKDLADIKEDLNDSPFIGGDTIITPVESVKEEPKVEVVLTVEKPKAKKETVHETAVKEITKSKNAGTGKQAVSISEIKLEEPKKEEKTVEAFDDFFGGDEITLTDEA